MEIPGGPLVLPPVDNMWGMQPSASPPTIAPPEKGESVGLQATVPPVTLEGWYNTIPPQWVEDGLVDNRTGYYVRCLGGPAPCPYTVPPAILRYWMPVSQMALANAEASTSLGDSTEEGAQFLNVTSMMGFQVGRTIIIDAGTPIQEVNVIAGFGSLILQFPLKYKHLKGVLITMPKVPATTPAPLTMPPMAPWSKFIPFAPNFFYGPAPGPAPYPFPAPAPAPVPAPAPLIMPPPLVPIVSGFTAAAPAPGGGPAPAPAPGPAPR